MPPSLVIKGWQKLLAGIQRPFSVLVRTLDKEIQGMGEPAWVTKTTIPKKLKY